MYCQFCPFCDLVVGTPLRVLLVRSSDLLWLSITVSRWHTRIQLFFTIYAGGQPLKRASWQLLYPSFTFLSFSAILHQDLVDLPPLVLHVPLEATSLKIPNFTFICFIVCRNDRIPLWLPLGFHHQRFLLWGIGPCCSF